jgi:hypothetical protein
MARRGREGGREREGGRSERRRRRKKRRTSKGIDGTSYIVIQGTSSLSWASHFAIISSLQLKASQDIYIAAHDNIM